MHYIIEHYFGHDHNMVEGDQTELVAIFKDKQDADEFAVGGFVSQLADREQVRQLITVKNELSALLG